MATKVMELDLSDTLRPIWYGEGYDSLYVLVRYRRRPLAWVWISRFSAESPVVSVNELRQAINDQAGWQVMQSLLAASLNPGQREPISPRPISVIVCTRDRTEQLAYCIESLLTLDYPAYEVIIVDNVPQSDKTEQLARRLRVRYVREERPGLDHARNRGVQEARYEIVAFTDDDARVDRFWLQAINEAFANPAVAAVSGFVGPAELETTAQYLFEIDYGGMGHGFRRRTIRQDLLTEEDLMWASSFGVGVNMAFRRELFTKIGLFDVALDVGTPSCGAGDVEMFHRTVSHGYTMVYDPAMLVWHTHRRYMPALRQQIYDNGRSFGCYLLTCRRNRTVKPFAILKFFLYSWLGKWILRNLIRRRHKLPRRLVLVELAGMLTSPLAYRKSQIRARQIAANHKGSSSKKTKTDEAMT